MRRSHLVAPTLAATTAAAVASPRPVRRLARVALAVYAATLGAETMHQASRGYTREAMMLPAIYAAMHLSWGAAFWVGAARFGAPVVAVQRALSRDRRRAGTAGGRDQSLEASR